MMLSSPGSPFFSYNPGPPLEEAASKLSCPLWFPKHPVNTRLRKWENTEAQRHRDVLRLHSDGEPGPRISHRPTVFEA